jgi:hypothetical protein
MTHALFHVKLSSILAISPISHSRQACLLPHIKPETDRRPLPTTNRTADTVHVAARKTAQSGAARPATVHSVTSSPLTPHASLLPSRLSPLAHEATRPRGHEATGTVDTGYVAARKATQSGAARPTTVHSLATSPLTAHRSPRAARPRGHTSLVMDHTPNPLDRNEISQDGPSTSIGAAFHVKHERTDCTSLPWAYSPSLPHCSSWKPRSPAHSTQSQSTSGDPSCVGTPYGRSERGGDCRCTFSAQSAAAQG